MKKLFSVILFSPVVLFVQGIAQTNTFPNSGNVGIGTTSPDAPLDIKIDQNGVTRAAVRNLSSGSAAEARYDLSTNTGFSYVVMGLHDNSGSPYYHFGVGSAVTSVYNDAPEFNFRNIAGDLRLKIASNGNVGIGTSSPQSKLAVNGEIYARKVKVTQTGWPDYVFHPNYRLRPLTEVEQYIQQYHHLPEVTSAADIEKDGVDLGDSQATLLKKIEELTLYIISLNKEVESLKKDLKQIKAAQN